MNFNSVARLCTQYPVLLLLMLIYYCIIVLQYVVLYQVLYTLLTWYRYVLTHTTRYYSCFGKTADMLICHGCPSFVCSTGITGGSTVLRFAGERTSPSSGRTTNSPHRVRGSSIVASWSPRSTPGRRREAQLEQRQKSSHWASRRRRTCS